MEGLFVDEVSRETAPGGGVGSASPAVCEPRPSRCNVGASNLPLAFSPCEAWNLRIAAVVSSSHFPLGEPCNEPLFASAACISMIRSLVGAFWPGCFLDFLEAGDLLEFFRETFAELLPAGLLAVFPVAVDFVAVDFVSDARERPAALLPEVEFEAEVDFFAATAWLGALLPAVLFTLLFVEAAAVLLPELPEVVLLPEAAFT